MVPLLLASLLAASPNGELPTVIVLDFATTNAPEDTTRLITDLTTVVLDETRRYRVLSSKDVKDQLKLEAERQALGCDPSSESCIAEIAGALGARLVFSGSVGELGETLIVTLSLYDSDQGRNLARRRLEVREPDTLSARLTEVVDDLVREAAGDAPRGEGPGALFWIGAITGSVALVGAGVTGVAAALDYGTLTSERSSGADKAAALDRGLPMVITASALSAVVVAGAAVATLGLGGE